MLPSEFTALSREFDELMENNNLSPFKKKDLEKAHRQFKSQIGEAKYKAYINELESYLTDF